MKLEYAKIEPTLNALSMVLKERMATKISLAVSKSIKNLAEAHVSFLHAKEAIIGTYAKKGENGQFLVEKAKVTNPDGSVTEGDAYVFNSEEEKNECSKKLMELEKTQVEVLTMVINEEDIEKEANLAPIHTTALLLLTN